MQAFGAPAVYSQPGMAMAQPMGMAMAQPMGAQQGYAQPAPAAPAGMGIFGGLGQPQQPQQAYAQPAMAAAAFPMAGAQYGYQ